MNTVTHKPAILIVCYFCGLIKCHKARNKPSSHTQKHIQDCSFFLCPYHAVKTTGKVEKLWLLLVLDFGTGWGGVVVTPRPRFTPGDRDPPQYPLRLERIPQNSLVIIIPDLYHDHVIKSFSWFGGGWRCVFLRCYAPRTNSERFLASKSCMQKVHFIIDGISA